MSDSVLDVRISLLIFHLLRGYCTRLMALIFTLIREKHSALWVSQLWKITLRLPSWLLLKKAIRRLERLHLAGTTFLIRTADVRYSRQQDGDDPPEPMTSLNWLYYWQSDD